MLCDAHKPDFCFSGKTVLLPMMLTAKVKALSTKYRPGSAMMCTPFDSGKYSSSADLNGPQNCLEFQDNSTKIKNSSLIAIVLTSSKETFADFWPGNPPPMSSRSKWNPACSPISNAVLASATALGYAAGSLHPLPTWKLTPITVNPRLLAAFSNSGTSSKRAPNLSPSGHLASISVLGGMILTTSLQI